METQIITGIIGGLGLLITLLTLVTGFHFKGE